MSLRNYVEHLQSQGLYWCLRNDIIIALKINAHSFQKAAKLLAEKNKLKRVKGDFYIIVPPEYRATGSLPATWFIDALMTHLKQPYYVSLLTSASLQGAAHQQSMVFQVISTKAMRNITVGQVRIEFIRKNTIHPHYYKPIKTATGKMNVATVEMTAFDLLTYMNKAGQINSIATVLCELAEKLDVSLLTTLLEAKEVPLASAQRLGYLLETLKLPLNLDQFARVVTKKEPSQRLLVTGSDEPVIEYNPKWHIKANENVEPDEL